LTRGSRPVARTAAANSFDTALLSSPRTDTPAQLPEPDTDVAVSPAFLAASGKAGAPARKRLKAGAPAPLNDLQANLLVFSQVLDAETKEPDSSKIRRLRRSMKSAKDHVAISQERLKRFLAQQKRRAKGYRGRAGTKSLKRRNIEASKRWSVGALERRGRGKKGLAKL